MAGTSLVPGHSARRRANVAGLVADGIGETVHERLAVIINRLEATRKEAGDRPRCQYLAIVARHHIVQHLFQQVQRPGDVGVDPAVTVGNILVQKPMAKATPGVSAEQIYLSAIGRGQQSIDALQCR